MAASSESIRLLMRSNRPVNAYEETMQRLLQSIRLGLIGPGDRLPAERELSEMLKVSRDTVREAISTLADAGYVVSRRGRYGGTFVVAGATAAGAGDEASGRRLDPPAPADLEDLDDLFALRRVLEVGVAREAAARELPEAARTALRVALTECSTAQDAEFRRLDSRLHLAFAELTGSPELVRLVADTRTRVNALLDGIPMLAPNLSHSQLQHEAIVAAVLAGEVDAAAEAMREHVEGTEALLRGFFSSVIPQS